MYDGEMEKEEEVTPICAGGKRYCIKWWTNEIIHYSDNLLTIVLFLGKKTMNPTGESILNGIFILRKK